MSQVDIHLLRHHVPAMKSGADTRGDAGVVDFITQPIFEAADHDVLWPVSEPAYQVTKHLGVLSYPSAPLADGFYVVSGFAINQGGP